MMFSKHIKTLLLAAAAGLFFILNQSCSQPGDSQLSFPDYPQMKIGFSTQNFMKAFPFSYESVRDLLHYASEEGYQFIELRDRAVELTQSECEALAGLASQLGLEVIYEIHVSLLDTSFSELFKKSLDNTETFGNPGILRAVIMPESLAIDTTRTGWNIEELKKAAIIAEESAKVAEERGITFVVENLIEPFIGDPPYYYGFNDLFQHTERVGFQFDLCNPFALISRKQADPDQVAAFLESAGNRWITTHIKTSLEGIAQPVLGDNPLPIPRVLELMGKAGVTYFSLELFAVEDSESCFRNHEKSIRYLMDLGIIEKR